MNEKYSPPSHDRVTWLVWPSDQSRRATKVFAQTAYYAKKQGERLYHCHQSALCCAIAR